MRVNFSDLLNKTLKTIHQDGNETLTFVTVEGEEYLMHHEQDCCENVYLQDVAGDLNDLIGSPIVLAEENSNRGDEGDSQGWPKGIEKPTYVESWEWTFYRIGTAKGTVVLRWYGGSNGYYSTSVSFIKLRTNISLQVER
jgi:hypothetical protein